ncbi:MAG: hypothetical protein QCH96_02305 [Candidatus Thermoplasmatota archaeon]|nr:hypothetical protein [Candidatus Thermoplasmatota archaeon]
MSHRPDVPDQRLFHASEIGQFHFCSIAWYLQRCGYRPESPFLKKGTQTHDRVGKNLIQLDKRKKRIRFLRICAVGFFVIGLLIGVYEVVSSLL